MTKRYTGGVISSSLPTVNAAGASGVFLLSQQADYQSRNSWPPFKVEESLRFRGAASAKLSRTVTTSSAGTKGTFSAWIKRGKDSDSTNNGTLVAAADNYYYGQFYQQTVYFGDTTYYLNTAAVFRDPAAWYHVVFVIDTTQATSSNRMQIWVNGIRQTSGSFAVYPTLNYTFPFLNNVQAWYIGGRASDSFFDGYMSEVYFVDGLALTPSSFGATDKDGNWSPIAYTGTYGQNGFYLNFSNNTSATTMGSDSSGNGNNWTLNGFNVSTANTSYDIMIDVPSDQSGANNRGNFCTINPLMQRVSQLPGATPSNGNLTTTHTPPSYGSYVYGSMAVSSGKWYYEMTATTVVGTSLVGLDTGQTQFNNYDGLIVYFQNGNKQVGASYVSYGATWTSGDVIGVAYDLDGGTVTFYKNGTSQGVAATGVSGTYMPHAQGEGGGTYNWNFGQRPFAYEPPSGFKTLNTFNLSEPTIKQPNKYFDVNLWTGNGTSQNIVNNGSMQPDLVWVKQRNGTYRHQLVDAIRGATRSLFSSDSDSEATYQGVTAFNSNGFSVGTELGTNENGSTFVGWQWNAGNANTTNTSGTITSIVRANPTAGFSIVTWTGNGTSGATVGHGLSVTPSCVILKGRSVSTNWQVKHVSLNANQNLELNSTAAVDTAPGSGYVSAISSSTLTLLNGGGAITNVNGSGSTYVAYCFAPIAGYSAFGSYTGNGSTDGPFVHTGFRPAFIIIKRTDAVTNWGLEDNKRSGYNEKNDILYPNSTAAEDSGSTYPSDFLSNGFKLRNTSFNASGGTYIYMAFAEVPFKYARSR